MNLPASNPSTSLIAYAYGSTIKLAPLGCPYCRREVRAHDVQPLDHGEVRIVCHGCHRDLLTIESQ